MNTYLYLKKISFVKQTMGALFLIFSAVLLLISITALTFILSFFSFFVGLYLATTEGIEIRFDTKQFRIIFSIFGLNIGVWESYPTIAYIVVVRTKVRHIIGNRYRQEAASTTIKDERICINVFSETNNNKTLFRTIDANEALEIADVIASFYKVEIKKKL